MTARDSVCLTLKLGTLPLCPHVVQCRANGSKQKGLTSLGQYQSDPESATVGSVGGGQLKGCAEAK